MLKSVTVACLFAALAVHAQVPCKWDAEASESAAAKFDCYRGETLEFQPTFLEYGVTSTNATYTLLWQTNGMGTAWWSTNILQFTPAMDVGASSYTVFIRALKTNGISYRANAKIKMLGSPGHNPNEIELPARSIDFATVTVANAPWLLSSNLSPILTRLDSVESKTNAWNTSASWGNHAAAGYLSASIWLSWLSTNTYVKVESDPTVPSYVKGITDAQIIAWNSGTNRSDRTYTLYGNTNSWQTVENGTATLWRVTYTNGYLLQGFESPDYSGFGPDYPPNTFIYMSPSSTQGEGNILIFDIPKMSGYPYQWHLYLKDNYFGETETAVYTDEGALGIPWRANSATFPITVPPDPFMEATGYWIFSRVLIPVTNSYPLLDSFQMTAEKELHADSYTNVIWRSVYSNGWMWLVAYTNYPSN
jgi:hypothetical protein